MVADALMLLQYKVSREPVIFHFFDGKFTLPALQDLYRDDIPDAARTNGISARSWPQ